MKYIIYDPSLKRPGCVLLQAALGGTDGIAEVFPDASWLLAPTDGMGLYEVDDAQLKQLITITEKALTCRRQTATP
jgi:hypothetical protein